MLPASDAKPYARLVYGNLYDTFVHVVRKPLCGVGQVTHPGVTTDGIIMNMGI